MSHCGLRRPQICSGIAIHLAIIALLLVQSFARCDAQNEAQKEAYRKFSAGVSPANLSRTIRDLTGFGSRIAGYPGDRKAAEYVERQFRAIGLERITVDEFNVSVPFDPGVEDPSRGATAEFVEGGAGGPRKMRMYPLWPNLVRTSTLPEEGLTAPVIYVRDGRLRNFNGKDVSGSIVMVDFNCASEWLNAPRLGAKAVIFVAPTDTMRGEAEAKFISIPISIPRFYMTQKEAAPLLAACASGRPPKVKLTCRMPWLTRPVRNITGWIPGTDPKMRDQVIVVQAYYDTISVVPALAPGADTTCGIAAMFEMMRAFKANPPKRTMMFVATSGHFQALKGIREYVHRHMEEWQAPGWFQRRATPQTRIYLWVGLDLTSQTRSFGIFYKGWFYDYREDIQGRFSDIARVCRENAEKVGNTLGFNSKRYFNDGVNPVDGKNWRNYIPGKPAFDSEVVTMAGGNGVTFATTDDSRALVDTPFDTPDRVNIANLAQQVRLINCLMWHIVTDTNEPGDINAQRMPITEPSRFARMALQGGFATLQGRVQLFDPKKSFIATSDPRLADSLVIVRNRNKSFMGVRGNMIQRTEWQTPDRMRDLVRDANGEVMVQNGMARNQKGEEVPPANFFAFHGVAPLTAYGINKPAMLAAYHLDRNGEIDYAPDLGTSGAKYIPLDVMMTTAVKETPLIVFRCVPTAIFDLVDQQSLRSLTGIAVYDGETNGEPRMYGYAIDPLDPGIVGSYVEDVAVLFSQPGTRLKIVMQSGPAATRLLLINSIYDPADPFNKKQDPNFAPEGIGYLVAGDPREQQNADLMGVARIKDYNPAIEIARSGAIYDTALHVAEDMWKLDDYRMQRLARYRILDMNGKEGVPGLHNRAREAIERARKAREAKDWEAFDAASREAWGLESRAYPDVQRTATDVVQGVLFYLALLLPFAYFSERLLFGFFDLKRQLSVAGLIFLIIFALFRYVHPAFDITMNPIIVLLAFIMLALSCIVIALIAGKFEEQLKQLNQSIGGVHRADIGRVSVALAAFNLGISNMRRRKARTFLTCVTLILLTFTVLSFTSVVQVMRFNQVPAPNDYGPRYNGIMLRTAMWEPLQEPAYRTLLDEFGRNYAVAPRAWFFGTQLGEQSFLSLRRADKQYEAKALTGLSPAEAKLLRPQEALLTDEKTGKPIGRWFEEGDVYTMILPDVIAQALRIEPEDVGKAKVTYSGVEYTVIGILDSQKLKEFADLDNEIITPVDFIAMNKLSRQGAGGGDQGFREYTHLEPDMVFFIPYQTAVNLGAELRSIAIDFQDPKQVMERLNPLMHRLALNLYAGQITRPEARDPRERGTIMRYSAIAATSSRGLEMVFFPILIASLIVLNTMLGSVFERIKEIHIFSSIGLAPAHIGMLFIAEAMVYAILGSVSGYLLGQFTSKILVWTGWLPELYLNFSSVSAVLTTLIVVGVVLLSTLYPARKAAEVATPAIERSWRVPEPDGDHWVIPLPFAVTGEQASGLNSFLGEWFEAYEEYSIGDFVTQNVKQEEFEHPNGKAYRIQCMTWLAPFDLGVSQRVTIETTPTDTEDVFDIRLLIDRESGDISNWKRVNRRFLNTLRKQFLIWRTLKQADRERYLRQTDYADRRSDQTVPPMSGAQPATGT
ncbi:MAG: FtsX-like permease family protein [Chloroherpetonaceae bacterium]|nr:M28 family peptidase [Chthonomonadaceae bacterium]MDW8207503.1 FtsX-like permease family protein [Chloroherpetonaceae bacterium]